MLCFQDFIIFTCLFVPLAIYPSVVDIVAMRRLKEHLLNAQDGKKTEENKNSLESD